MEKRKRSKPQPTDSPKHDQQVQWKGKHKEKKHEEVDGSVTEVEHGDNGEHPHFLAAYMEKLDSEQVKSKT